MTTLLPLAMVTLVTMWLIFFVAVIFFQEGDDKRTLLVFSSAVLALLAVFAMLIPTYNVVSIPAYNVILTNGNSVSNVAYPAVNETTINPPYSNSVITLYTVFAVFMAFIFVIFAIWNFRHRLQYQTFKQYEDELRVRKPKK